MSGTSRRLLVVSHPNVVPSNQAVYLELLHRGWDVVGVMPDRWKDHYHPDGYATRALEGLEGRMRFVPVAVAGEPQRHFYLTNVHRVIRELRPGIAFIEQEPFAIPALQWGAVLHHLAIPFGLQADENLDRPFPWPAKVIRRWLLPRASWIAARSPTALRVNRAWGAKGAMHVVPHTVPDWTPVERVGDPVFTVGFAGRLVPEKGITDLLAAVRRLDGPVRLLVVGDGPVREQLEAAQLDNATIEIRRRIPERAGPRRGLRRDGRARGPVAHHADVGRAVRARRGRGDALRPARRGLRVRRDRVGDPDRRGRDRGPRG